MLIMLFEDDSSLSYHRMYRPQVLICMYKQTAWQIQFHHIIACEQRRHIFFLVFWCLSLFDADFEYLKFLRNKLKYAIKIHRYHGTE